MGRLFWKVFFAFWLAQLTAGAGVGTVVWLRHQALETAEPRREPPWHNDPMLDAATATLRHAGVAALRGLLADGGPPKPPVYAVDEIGREILDRKPSPATLAQARQVAQTDGVSSQARLIAAADGHTYLLFMPFAEHNRFINGRPGFPRLPSDAPPGGPTPMPREPPTPPFFLVVAGSLASLLFSAWLAWYLARPIRHLRTAFDALADGRLDTRVGLLMGQRRDELADLGRNFDHMAGQVGGLVDAQRRLLHDVSHELRSPLARLQVAVGLARQQPAKLEATLERIERESMRLDTLVGELLALSRLEAGVQGAAEETIDIAGLLTEITTDARFEAEASNVRVELRAPATLTMRGRTELIRRALENIIRNAIQHAPAGSLVHIEAKLEGKPRKLRLDVCDQGPGLPEGQLTAIFEPFFRGETQRGKNGAGLGLAIARRAVATHGGTIKASNRPGGGLCVEILWPVLAE